MSDKKRAPVGIESFAELVSPEQNYVFVDRTSMIKQIFDDGAKVLAFHTFRRGGKSLLASMLQHFFAAQGTEGPTTGMFNDLEIGKYHPEFLEKHQGQYPVIKISLKWVQNENFEGALTRIGRIIHRLYKEHQYLLTSKSLSEEDHSNFSHFYTEKKYPLLQDALEESLLLLSELLHKHHGKKSIVIIDEYDTPLTNSMIYNDLDRMSLFMKNFLGAVFKTNDYLEKGILIGILRVSRESLLSSLNNIKICTLLKPHGYRPYLGFTEQDVRCLFAQLGFALDIELIKQWYDGYLVGGQSLYNPWSIINYLDALLEDKNNTPDSYWVATANDNLLKDSLLAMPSEVKDQFRQLIVTDEPVEVSLSEVVRFEDISSKPTAMWGLLLGAGYITPAQGLRIIDHHYEGLIRIPNREIKGLYVEIFASWLKDTLHISRPSLFRTLCRGDVETFGQLIGNYLLEHASARNLKNEACYHNLLLGLSAELLNTYHIFSDTMESGLGYPDMMIVPKTKEISHLAIVLEFKQARPSTTARGKKQNIPSLAQEALQQIEQRQHVVALTKFPHITRVLKVGMAFQGKEVFWTSQEEDLQNTGHI